MDLTYSDIDSDYSLFSRKIDTCDDDFHNLVVLVTC